MPNAIFTTKKYVDDKINNKQDTLVSGTNIKTINGESLLGSGNIKITPEPSIDITSLLGGQTLTTEQLEIIKNNNIVRFYSQTAGVDVTACKVSGSLLYPSSELIITFSVISSYFDTAILSFQINSTSGEFSSLQAKVAQDIQISSDEILRLYSGDTIIGVGVSKIAMQSWLNSQEKLISGTNIKTINNQSQLGS